MFGAIKQNPIEEEVVQNPFDNDIEHGAGSLISIIAVISCIALVTGQYKLIQFITN